MSRFDNHLKKHMININKNLYISPSDPLYNEKILRYIDPHSPEAHYKLGQKHERQGSLPKALHHYTEATSRIDSPYYSKAKKSIKALEDKRNKSNVKESEPSPIRKRKVPMYAKSIIAFLLLFNLFLLFTLFAIDPIRATVSNMNQWNTGMNVVYESSDVPYIIYLPMDEPNDKIEETLYQKAVDMGKEMANQNLLLYGVVTSDSKLFHQVRPLKSEKIKEKAFVIVEYNSAHDQSVKIRFLNSTYHTETSKDKPGSYPLSFIGTNIVRTAIQAYLKEEGLPPDDVENLVGDYPNNYLSFIPNEVESGSNQVFNEYNGQGGWVYNREANDISEMFYPNSPDYFNRHVQIPFSPIEIIVSKEDFSLVVKSDTYIIASKTVGLGKDNVTPKGLFTIDNRVLEPRGTKPNMFGVAGLGMGELAIHGTYDEESIGDKQSLGCIRLSNKDVMDIYPFVPKGTTVRIKEERSTSAKSMAVQNTEKLLPPFKPQTQQTTDRIFDWLGVSVIKFST